jgi:digeranylgeranylglycerophospholipid reductase
MKELVKSEYDVIVVGCGPAGTSTAKECAKRGLRVLALDRNLEIGTPVRCGEGLSSNSVKILKLDIPQGAIAQKIKGAIVYAPNGKRLSVTFEGTEGYVLERKMFDKWLAMEASRAGATVIAKSNVYDVIIEKGKVCGVKANIVGEDMTIRSKIVVAADGVESVIARKAGLRSAKNPMFVDSGFQYEMSGIDLEDPHMIILYFGAKIAPRGYVWIFPKGKDAANVGIGIGGMLGGMNTAKKYLDAWIKTMPGLMKGSIVEVNGGCIPVGNFMKSMVSDGCLGVGDSVNQVNPIHGGGIAESIKASRIAADVLTKAVKSGNVSATGLEEYNKRWWEERGNSLKNVEKVREMFEKMSDEEMNDLAEVLSGEDLVDFAHGKSLPKLMKIYAKYKMKGIKRKIGL